MKLTTRMLMKFSILFIALMLAISGCLFGIRRNTVKADASSGPSQPILLQDEDKPSRLHKAGLRGDRSQAPLMIAALQVKQMHGYYATSALHALSRMGATEALPAIEPLIQDEQYPIISREAKVAKARLLAEDSVKSLADKKARPAARINRFYTELGLNSADINAAVADYETNLSQQLKSNTYDGSLLKPLELFAMGEIADMVYRGDPYRDYAALPGVAQLNFQLDAGSALKMRLAPLSQKDRLSTLVGELAHDQTYALTNAYKMQLVADEDQAGSRAVAAQLYEMDAHKADYPEENFMTLFKILGAIGDKDQAPLMAHFRNEGGKGRTAREAYDGITSGFTKQFVYGY